MPVLFRKKTLALRAKESSRKRKPCHGMIATFVENAKIHEETEEEEEEIQTVQACNEDWPNIKIESSQACNGDRPSM
ncbi:hypothetical protein TNCV_1958141 [Trichonephila clavipes]|nr:hypothetical protein TNCV_1958141 [Trichonephila clavipes]